MSHASTAARVRLDKEAHPEKYCPVGPCLWRVGGANGSDCRKHPPVRETCEHCGKPVARDEDGDMQVTDARIGLLCWSDDRRAKFCDKDPKRPGAPHREDCPCDDCYVDQD